MKQRGGGGDRAVTVVTWNMNHWQNSNAAQQSAWDYLHGPLAAQTGWDVALLQECAPPEPSARCVFAPVRDHAWGSAVLVRAGSIRRIELEDDSHPGCVVAAEVTRENGTTITAVSLYGLQEYARRIDGECYDVRYAVTAVHRMLSDLTPLIDQHSRHRTKRPLLLGGDLNISSQIDPPDRGRHLEVLERCAGAFSARRLAGGRGQRTRRRLCLPRRRLPARAHLHPQAEPPALAARLRVHQSGADAILCPRDRR